MGDLVFLKRMSLKGKHKIKDSFKKTIYCLEGQPYAGLLVFGIAAVERKGKVKVVHWNMLLPSSGNGEYSENWESQQDANELSDCIQAVSEGGEAETEVVLSNPEPESEVYAIHVQSVQTVYEPNYWVNTIWGSEKSLFCHQ